MSGLKILEKSWKKFRKAFDKRQINAKLSFYVTGSAGADDGCEIKRAEHV